VNPDEDDGRTGASQGVFFRRLAASAEVSTDFQGFPAVGGASFNGETAVHPARTNGEMKTIGNLAAMAEAFPDSTPSGECRMRPRSPQSTFCRFSPAGFFFSRQGVRLEYVWTHYKKRTTYLLGFEYLRGWHGHRMLACLVNRRRVLSGVVGVHGDRVVRRACGSVGFCRFAVGSLDSPTCACLPGNGHFYHASDISSVFHAMNTSPTGLEKSTANAPGVRSRRILGAAIGWGAVVLAVGASIVLARWATQHPRSDSAKVSAPVIGIAPRVSGPILSLPVHDNQLVAAGEILFEIDPEPYALAAAVAQANLEAVNGELENAKRAIDAQRMHVRAAMGTLALAETTLAETTETYGRLAPLLAKRYASPEQVDSARRARDSSASAVEVARAELAAAEASVLDTAALQARQRGALAALAQAELAVRDCVVRAPFEGRVAGMNLAAGAFARIGVDVMTFIDTGRWYVVADFRETDLRGIRTGAPARVEIMTAPGRNFPGKVESMGWGVTDLPQDPFGGLPIVLKELDWVRLSQRFPVRIRLGKEVPQDVLRVGATATATVMPGDPAEDQ